VLADFRGIIVKEDGVVVCYNCLGQRIGGSMYFLCHAWSDNEVADPIARSFIKEFGEEKVFYDRWNVQPGDSITGDINEALGQCEIFFLFFSQESQSRAMAKREWQAALSRAVKGKNKFIIVRLDNIDPPPIVDDLAFIDMFSIGSDEALVQMIAICKGEKAIRIDKAPPFRNLVSRTISQSPTEMVVEVSARRFAVQSPIIGVYIPSLGVDDYDVRPAQKEGQYQAGTVRDRLPDGSVKIEMRQVTLMRPVEPGRPLLLRIKFNEPILSVKATIYHCTGRAFICISPAL
jgi:hypothetical protein